ncbi:MAG: GPR endopeptidase [Oscillospiraceae bacterium]|nr:GPR endopeptidase [Oscillospiraceae bacterium]
MIFQPKAARTDLAMELSDHLPEGTELRTGNSGGFAVTDIHLKSESAARSVGKAVGRYLTLEPRDSFEMIPSSADEYSMGLAGKLRELLGDAKTVFVAGLGNESITPDSLGPRVVSHIFATRHIPTDAPELDTEGLRSVSCAAPGVMGQTGIETAEFLSSLIEKVSPDAVIVIDALACQDPRHLGRTIQLTDAGISPGSGVMNSRSEVSHRTLGIPCIAIGVPTVADAGTKDEPLMVTPKNIDKLISTCAMIISGGINACLQPGLTLGELRLLTA